MRARARRSLALAAALLAGRAAAAFAGGGEAERAAEAALVARGERIYREGILPSGAPLEATAQAGVRRSGAEAACAACHRRSGYGGSEGPVHVPPVTGPALFGWRELKAPPPAVMPPGMSPANAAVAAQAARLAARKARAAAQLGTPRRAPYDDASLARALREGVDVAGRPLAAAMPRYALGDEEARALAAYLRTLSAAPSPGVGDDELRLATVIQPGVDPARRRAMLEVLRAFLRDKNAGTRSEAQRREAGTERMYRAHRTWVLDVWELAGPSEGWEAQLQAHYERRPVFALVGGLGAASWAPIHAFGERVGLPCLFPQVDLPVLSEAGFYTVYLSRGITLEAEALAKWLGERAGAPGARVVQVSRREARSAAAAAALRAAGAVEDRVLDGPADRAFWERVAREAQGASVVAWLEPGDLAEAGALLDRGGVEAVYLSATLLGRARPPLARSGDDRVRLVHPLDLPRAREPRLLRVKRWLRERGIAPSDERVQLDAYFAVTVTADAISHMAELFSREYLVERIEHMVGNTVTPSLYPRVSLGPGQRFASKGSFIVKTARGGGELEPLSGWITP